MIQLFQPASKSNETQSLLDWTQENRYYLSLDRRFDLHEHLYLEELYDVQDKEIVYCKAGQVGISELLVSYVLWCADKRDCTGLYVFPTAGHVSDFSAARIGPAIDPDVSPYLHRIVKSGAGKTVDRVSLRRVRNRFIYLRGAMVKPDGRAPQLRSVDADIAVADEYDEMDTRALPLIRERLGHSKIAEIRIASTPTYYTTGVYKLYTTGTDMRQWIIRCKHCGARQDLHINDLVTEWDDLKRPVTWHKNKAGEPFLACRKCKKPLDRLSPGEWVAKHPGRGARGYHLSRLFMGRRSLVELLDSEHLGSTDEAKRKETFNQWLGVAYRSSRSFSVDAATLDACQRSYGYRMPKSQNVYAGIDVGSVLHVVIREKNKIGNELLLYAGMVGDFNEAEYVLKRYLVKTCVIDALPETRKSRELQSAFPDGVVWLCYYTARDKHEPSEQWNYNEWTVNADRTRTLDAMYAGLLSASKGEIGKTLPRSIKANTDYYDQLCALERVLKTGTDGNQSAVYVGDPDHFAHAENYCAIAGRCEISQGWSRGPG